jgi:hypothetical protein
MRWNTISNPQRVPRYLIQSTLSTTPQEYDLLLGNRFGAKEVGRWSATALQVARETKIPGSRNRIIPEPVLLVVGVTMNEDKERIL